MSNIQKTLDSLQPYVIGIRYVQGQPVVDVVFKDGWTVLESEKIKKSKGDESLNYYMVYSDTSGVGLDELLAYVETTIKANQDREKKHDLLKIKVNELKELFKKTPLTKLHKLRFEFSDELATSINDIDFEEETIPEQEEPTTTNETDDTPMTPEEKKPVQYLDENKNPIPLSDEDLEILEEEKRAEQYKKLKAENKSKNDVKNLAYKKVALPPKRVEENVARPNKPDCNCGEEEACPKCIDYKNF